MQVLRGHLLSAVQFRGDKDLPWCFWGQIESGPGHDLVYGLVWCCKWFRTMFEEIKRDFTTGVSFSWQVHAKGLLWMSYWCILSSSWSNRGHWLKIWEQGVFPTHQADSIHWFLLSGTIQLGCRTFAKQVAHQRLAKQSFNAPFFLMSSFHLFMVWSTYVVSVACASQVGSDWTCETMGARGSSRCRRCKFVWRCCMYLWTGKWYGIGAIPAVKHNFPAYHVQHKWIDRCFGYIWQFIF